MAETGASTGRTAVIHAIAVSDAHLHDDSRLEEVKALCSYLERQHPPLLVLVGDIGDPWRNGWEEIRRTESWKSLSALCAARDSAGLKTIYIRGNHDAGARAKYLQGARVRWRYKDRAVGVLFTHGSEWDPFWGGMGGRIACWICERAPWLAALLYNAWSKWQAATPSALKSKDNTGEWDAKTEMIHARAQEYARKRALRVVVGHTHSPWLGRFAADAGDWEDSFSAVEITDDGKLALKHMAGGVMKDFGTEGRIDEMWPGENTAILVIHGSGPHRPFEALGSFARGFRMALQREGDPRVQWEHKVRPRNGWVQSYVSLRLEGKPGIDFYEYYWDCHMVRDVTLGEAVEWLDDASAGARRFYEEDMPKRAECYKDLKIDLFRDGEFDHLGYRAILGASKYLLRVKLLLRPFWRWSSRTLDNLIGDIVTYTTADVRSRNYDIRQKMMSGAVEELDLLLQDDRYGKVIVVGHSLGSMIAYDALNRINLDMCSRGVPSPGRAPRLRGLVTLGSPLDKIAFLYQFRLLSEEDKTRLRKKSRPRRNPVAVRGPSSRDRTAPPENFVQNAITFHLHSFKRLPLRIDGLVGGVADPLKCYLDGTIWLNFHHQKDLISGHLDAYKDVQNIECRRIVKGLSQAHSVYWTWDQMYRDIARHLF